MLLADELVDRAWAHAGGQRPGLPAMSLADVGEDVDGGCSGQTVQSSSVKPGIHAKSPVLEVTTMRLFASAVAPIRRSWVPDCGLEDFRTRKDASAGASNPMIGKARISSQASLKKP